MRQCTGMGVAWSQEYNRHMTDIDEQNLEIVRCSKAKCWCPFSCKYLNTMREEGGKKEEVKGSRRRREREGKKMR